jgi:hypothetical protein
MAKKNLAVLVIAVLAVSGVFAQSFSVGVGGYLGGDFGGGTEQGSQKSETPYFGGGGFAFFDATYAELSVGILFGSMTTKTGNVENTSSLTNVDIALLGKFPIEIGDSLSIFPLLGVDYQATLSVKDKNGKEADSPGDFSALWVKAGAGLDFSLTDSFFLRFEALYGIRLPNKVETDITEKDSNAKALLGHGPTIKLAAGFRF